MKRNDFIRTGILGVSGMYLAPVVNGRIRQKNDPFDISVVEEFVRAGHNDPEKVRKMLAEMPNLIYARYDWGGGDFEEAIEGAGHLGQKEIANFLIEKGARVSLFVLTMLGKTDLVIPVLEEYPALIRAKGPHGFTLLHHAGVGGRDSEEIYSFLSEKGLKDLKLNLD